MLSKSLWLCAIVVFLGLQTEVVTAQSSSDTVKITVRGACEMCSDRILKEADLTRGVRSSDYNLETEELTVVVNTKKFQIDDLHNRIAAAGHSTDKVETDQATYDNLPLCCQYRTAHAEEDQGAVHDQLKGFYAKFASGKVLELDENGEEVPVVAANVFWAGTTEGTFTDEFGVFVIKRSEETEKLVVSYVGFGSDTLTGPFQEDIKVLISNAVLMDEVEVVHRQKSMSISFLNTMKVESINEKELLKAACCNLSESFETNPSIDVSFTDAVTGTRQINMLGLAGPYVQITRENIPDIRGLSAIHGFTYTPGPWIQSIQLNKGAGSVVNGFESMTGQVNVELRKTCEGDLLYLNAYANQGSRLEGNVNMRHSFNENVSTAVLLHGSTVSTRFDRNDDGFLDQPLRTNLIGVNRWKFLMKNGWRSQIGVKGTMTDKTSGQINFDNNEAPDTSMVWGTSLSTRRADVWAKLGKVYVEKPYQSLGFQVSGVIHDQDAVFGVRRFDATQHSLYANGIFQSIIGDSRHQYKIGGSFIWDRFNEDFRNTAGLLGFERDEKVIGSFVEYSYLPTDNFGAVIGFRGDYHNTTGAFFTPRAHLRYAPSELTVLRASAGRGRRTPSIFSENIGLFASSRIIRLDGTRPSSGFGERDFDYALTHEVAWNFGFNITQGFTFAGRSAVLGLDIYRTDFQKQIVVDWDENAQSIFFYPLEGKSYANSFQVQFDIEVLDRFDVRLAYRFNDVKTQYKKGLLQKPLVSKHRAFINLGYETEDKWKFDFTLNWQGSKRLPSTQSNPLEYRFADTSPSFFMANAQISKTFGEKLEFYLGGENLFDFRQPNPIIAASEPFSDFFDASLAWGPIFGRNVYLGVRYRLQ